MAEKEGEVKLEFWTKRLPLWVKRERIEKAVRKIVFSKEFVDRLADILEKRLEEAI